MKNSHFSSIIEMMALLEDKNFRNTGRTTKTIEQVFIGDMIICLTAEDAKYHKAQAFLLNKTIETEVFKSLEHLLIRKKNFEKENPLNNVHLCHRVISRICRSQLMALQDQLQ